MRHNCEYYGFKEVNNNTSDKTGLTALAVIGLGLFIASFLQNL
jgi:hypothetical protein